MDPVTSAPDVERKNGGQPYQFLPPESTLAMTTQPLRHFERQHGVADFGLKSITLRRTTIFFGTAAMTLAGCYEMYEVLQVGGITILEAMVLVLFVLLFAWVAFSFMSALAGFVVLLFRMRDALGIDPDAPLPAVSRRNAMLLPTYNEDPHRIMARLRAIYESVGETGCGSQFDWYVLSDTTDPSIWIEEEKCFLQLRREVAVNSLFYRHRPENTARKSGNIEDWIRRFGAGYDHMIILDADSLMTGDAIVRLVAAMERHPKVALIQTLPIVVNARTPFARWQQFAGRLYGPLLAAGIAWWHGSEGNYWGHNAVIRVRAFAKDAGLPELRGRKPFGGHILSHDFVEAALMRRAGWAIHMAPTLGGSFEECPPSLLDFAARDRRWCQGNLQHMGVLPARGLHWVTRLHLASGIGAYVAAPLWLFFLFTGIMISLQAQFIRPEYFPKTFTLYPQWPAQDPVRAAYVFAGTMSLLLAPKLLGYLAMLFDAKTRRGFGGAIRAFFSMLAEVLISGLIAPIMMLIQSASVTGILMGRDSGWNAQRRDDGSLPLRDVVRRYARHTAFGIVLALAAYEVSFSLFAWMTPVIVGLILAIPLVQWSASPRVGRTLRRWKLLLTPEETQPPDVLTRANELVAQFPAGEAAGLRRLFADPALLAAHRALLPKLTQRKRGDVDVALVVALAKLEDCTTLTQARETLTRQETMALLSDARGVDRLAALSAD